MKEEAIYRLLEAKGDGLEQDWKLAGVISTCATKNSSPVLDLRNRTEPLSLGEGNAKDEIVQKGAWKILVNNRREGHSKQHEILGSGR